MIGLPVFIRQVCRRSLWLDGKLFWLSSGRDTHSARLRTANTPHYVLRVLAPGNSMLVRARQALPGLCYKKKTAGAGIMKGNAMSKTTTISNCRNLYFIVFNNPFSATVFFSYSLQSVLSKAHIFSSASHQRGPDRGANSFLLLSIYS